jgi:polyisoprenoid-binding protein YceI
MTMTARVPRLAFLAAAGLLAITTALAAPQTFDFKDPKGVNNAVFLLDAPLESINGTANGISGSVQFDPANPASLSGRIVVEAASLHVPNPMMKEHLHGKDWLDVATHKEITFETVRVANVKTRGAETTADVTGKLTIKGVTREITVPVRLTYLPDKLGARTNGRMQGDLLVVRSAFKIKRGDFGINPGAPTDKVADEIELTLSLAGAAPRS